MRTKPLLRTILATAALLGAVLGLDARAALFRSYVSSAGNDANPCTLPLPCRLLPAALAAVNDGGEIWMLDSANYNTGAVSILKSVTILAVPGAVGSVVGNSASAVVIAAAGAKVTLRNLVIVNIGSGGPFYGIHVQAAAQVIVEACDISGFTSNGYGGVGLNSNTKLVLSDTTVRGNQIGLALSNGSTTISRSRIVGNDGVGIYVYPTLGPASSAVITDSVLSGNHYGVYVYAPAGTTSRAAVSRTSVSENSISGLQVGGAGGSGLLELSENVIFANVTGVHVSGGTVAQSAGNNRIVANASAVGGGGSLTAVASQ